MGSLTGIAILGSTGSIGRQALEIIRNFPGGFKIFALTGRDRRLLIEQIEEFRPKLVGFEGASPPPGNYELASLEDIASHPEVDFVVVATSGKAGLLPTIAAIRSGKRLALANKEVLVMAGELVMEEAKRYKAEILPIDSEHSALWQCLKGEDRSQVSKIILTASGGPFLHLDAHDLENVSVEQALAHPTWLMGRKVTIDSATLMNKGMEVIEAHWLFGFSHSQIEIIIHPQSIIHSMIEFIDGSVKAQLSPPDMRLPIQYALTYPERCANPDLPKIDWNKVQSLSFEPPDLSHFPCLRLALEAGKAGGTYPAVLCAADEIAVELFLSHHIGFMDIPKLIGKALSEHQSKTNPGLEDILQADAWAREMIQKVSL